MYRSVAIKIGILYDKIQSVCVCVCVCVSMYTMNRTEVSETNLKPTLILTFKRWFDLSQMQAVTTPLQDL